MASVVNRSNTPAGDLREQLTAAIFPNKHSFWLNSECLPLYPQIHIIKDPHLVKVQRRRDCRVSTPNWSICSETWTPNAQGQVWKSWWEDDESQTPRTMLLGSVPWAGQKMRLWDLNGMVTWARRAQWQQQLICRHGLGRSHWSYP